MLLLESRSEAAGRGFDCIAVFGAGLIGHAVVTDLLRRLDLTCRVLPFSWLDRRQQIVDIDNLAADIDRMISRHLATQAHGRLSFLWSAGVGGLASTRETFADELDSFGRIVDLLSRIAGEHPEMQFHFHLVSSAGGLFEGQTFVSRGARPAPMSPYGEAKLQEELCLDRLPSAVGRSIYRASTVYGYANRQSRLGLISSLLRNGLEQVVTTVYGRLDTIRDYVFCDDIGNFIARRLGASNGLPLTETFTLASGKTSSIHEVITLVDKIIGRNVFLRFSPTLFNVRNNSYLPDVLHSGWMPTDLETGIRQTFRKMVLGG